MATIGGGSGKFSNVHLSLLHNCRDVKKSNPSKSLPLPYIGKYFLLPQCADFLNTARIQSVRTVFSENARKKWHGNGTDLQSISLRELNVRINKNFHFNSSIHVQLFNVPVTRPLSNISSKRLCRCGISCLPTSNIVVVDQKRTLCQ